MVATAPINPSPPPSPSPPPTPPPADNPPSAATAAAPTAASPVSPETPSPPSPSPSPLGAIPSSVNLGSDATAGNGGDSQNANGGNAGTANATISITSLNAHNIGATANQGAAAHGGNVTVGTANAGSGAIAFASASAVSGAGGIATAQSNGSSGGSVLNLAQGSGGNGGDATAFAISTDSSALGAQATARATGGAGGQGQSFGFFAGNGGASTATSLANASIGPALAESIAASGAPGAANFQAAPGTIGASNATATAFSSFKAESIASVSSHSGVATGIAKASPITGLISFIQSTATAPADNATNVDALAYIHLSPPPLANTTIYNSAAYLVATPVSTDVTTAWSNATNVKNAFANNTNNINLLALANLQTLANATAAPHTYSTILELNERNAQLNTNNLLIGTTAPHLDGAALQSGDTLRFRIQRNTITLVDQTFTTTAAFQSYFTNTLFNLGTANAGLNGANLDLQFLFDLTTSHSNAGLGAQFLLGTTATAQPGFWINPAGGSWATPTNWSANTLPNGPGTSATFGNVITAPQTVTLDHNTTIGASTFSSPHSYTIVPGAANNTLTLDNAGLPATITLTSGNHTLFTPLTLASPGLNISIAANNTLTISAAITGTAPLSITGPGHALLAPSTGTAKLSALTLTATTLDITNNKLIIEPASKPTALATLQGYLSNLTLTSSTLPANFGLALLDNAALNLTTFGGQPIDTNALLLSPELLGDVNADGSVDLTDLSTILNNFGTTTPAWTSGNFDNAPTIGLTDLAYVLNNFGQTIPGASAQSPTTKDQSPIPTPQPASLALLLAPAVWSSAFKRRCPPMPSER